MSDPSPFTLSRDTPSTGPERDAPVALLGLPQEDGSVPFVVAVPGPGDSLVVAGAVHADGLLGAQGGEASAEYVQQVIENVRADGVLVDVPVHGVLHFLMHAVDTIEVAALVERLPVGVRNAAQVLDPLKGEATAPDAQALAGDTVLLAEGPMSVAFALPQPISQAAIEPVLSALGAAGGAAARRAALGAVVAETADAALNIGRTRAHWMFALDTLTWRARVCDQPALADAARQTSLAMSMGADGRDVPFIFVWTERQLAYFAETALAATRG